MRRAASGVVSIAYRRLIAAGADPGRCRKGPGLCRRRPSVAEEHKRDSYHFTSSVEKIFCYSCKSILVMLSSKAKGEQSWPTFNGDLERMTDCKVTVMEDTG